jgi:hypothetical protein
LHLVVLDNICDLGFLSTLGDFHHLAYLVLMKDRLSVS